MDLGLADVPQHVPAELVWDVDIHAVQAIDPDIHTARRKLQSESPARIYSRRKGGHWIPMRARVIERVRGDSGTFISGGP